MASSSPANATTRRPRLVRKREMLLLDYAFLVLGLLSVLILALQFRGLHASENAWLIYADYATIGLFGLVFVGKLLAADNARGYFKSHWFAVVGLLPLTTSFIIPERFYVVVQVLIVISRFSQALDRAFGERVLALVFTRYRLMLIEELTDPILDRLLFVLQYNLTRGEYAASIGKSLDAHRVEIRAAVERGIRASPKASMAMRVPGAEEAVSNVVNEALDAAVAALTSEELNRAIQQSLHRSFEDLRGKVRERSWHQEGVGITDVAASLVRTA